MNDDDASSVPVQSTSSSWLTPDLFGQPPMQHLSLGADMFPRDEWGTAIGSSTSSSTAPVLHAPAAPPVDHRLHPGGLHADPHHLGFQQLKLPMPPAPLVTDDFGDHEALALDAIPPGAQWPSSAPAHIGGYTHAHAPAHAHAPLSFDRASSSTSIASDATTGELYAAVPVHVTTEPEPAHNPHPHLTAHQYQQLPSPQHSDASVDTLDTTGETLYVPMTTAPLLRRRSSSDAIKPRSPKTAARPRGRAGAKLVKRGSFDMGVQSEARIARHEFAKQEQRQRNRQSTLQRARSASDALALGFASADYSHHQQQLQQPQQAFGIVVGAPSRSAPSTPVASFSAMSLDTRRAAAAPKKKKKRSSPSSLPSSPASGKCAEFRSVISCGLPDSTAAAAGGGNGNDDDDGERILSQHVDFFGGPVDVYVAESDPESRTLFKASVLAKKVDCAPNTLAMYLSRRKARSTEGIYQATSFKHKVARRHGLKMGGYFVSLQVCLAFQAYLINQQKGRDK